MNWLISKHRGRHVFESVIAITDFGVHIEWVNPPSSVPWALSTLHCLLQLFFLCNRFPPFFLISKVTLFLCQELGTRWWGTCCLSIYIMVGQFIYSSPSNFTPAKRGYGVSSGLSILNIETQKCLENFWVPLNHTDCFQYLLMMADTSSMFQHFLSSRGNMHFVKQCNVSIRLNCANHCVCREK